MKRKGNAASVKAIPAKKHHWSAGLLDSMKDPEFKVKEDNKVVVINDKYPKAQFHYLVLPKEDIPTLWHVKEEHKDLLQHMHRVALDLTSEHKDIEFLIGYHAVPSMQRLHLHVISTDFDSPKLKTKHHWNSFTTPFFLPSTNICEELREKGKLKRPKDEESRQYLKSPLKCHKCPNVFNNMPNLKSHLLEHLSKKKV